MWPLSIFLFVATAAPQQPLDVFQDFRNLKLPAMQHSQSAAPQQQPLDVFQDFHSLKLPAMQHSQSNDVTSRRFIIDTRRNTCYTMRSYFFRRQDGNAPVPAGMTTCTPASVLQQRQVSPRPNVKFVPLGAARNNQ
jgi:hypothetical protein